MIAAAVASPLARKLVGGGVLLLGLWLFWGHYQGVKDERDQLKEDRERLLGALNVQTAAFDSTVAQWQAQYTEAVEALQAQQELSRRASREKENLLDIFSRHNLRALALRKPGLIENRINSGTQRILRLFIDATASGDPDSAGRGAAASPDSTGPGTDR